MYITEARRKLMKKKLVLGFILTITLLALLGTTACDALGGGESEFSQQLVEVTRGDLTIGVTGNGKIETSREARLTFGSAGKVAKILVEEGDKVSGGDVLARLDTSALELALAQSQMTLTQAEVTLAQAQLAKQTAEYNLKNIQDTEDALKLALFNAEVSLDIAQYDLDKAREEDIWPDIRDAEGELDRARAFLEYARDGLSKATENFDNWLMLVERAEERLKDAQTQYNNIIAGSDTEEVAIKKKQVEAAEMAVAQAQKNIDELAEDITIQELQIESASQSVKQAQQSVELARLSVNEAQRQLDEATIIAPFEGLVATIPAKEGDIIPSPSMAPTTIIHLINPDYMELVIEVDEIDIPLVELDLEADISVDALPDTVFKGVVNAVYPVPKEEAGVVLYNVRIGLDAPENAGIKVGMSASADIVTDKRSQVLLVPSRAIGKNDQGEAIVKVMSDELIQERVVVVGLDDGYQTEIRSGLREGETVVVEVRVRSTSGMSMF
jgi:HlyD family secretion protein